VILLVVLMLFGSKRLPEIARGIGRALEEFRRAARDVTDEIMHGGEEAGKEEEPRELLPPSRPGQPRPPEPESPEDDETT
jgi:sec-independent protein translocase protein TatA